MDFDKLSKEEKAAFKAKFIAEERAERERIKQDKDAYKSIQDEFVEKFFPKLVDVSDKLTIAKTELFEAARTIIDLKKSVYNITDEELENQQSHSLSNADYSKTIIIGHNITDGWDPDLSAAGLSKVNSWFTKQANNDNQQFLNMARNLLKPNRDGIMKAPRVLELRNEADKIGDPELIEGVTMISEAYIAKKSTTFVKAKIKTADGEIFLNLSMSTASEIPAKKTDDGDVSPNISTNTAS